MRTRIRLGAVLVCAGALLSGASLAAPATAGRKVEDLHYGDVLFHFYQGKYFDAITRLMAARQVGRAQAHASDADLLMGGMLLSYGQSEQASALFRKVLDSGAQADVRDRAWFFLARSAYDRGALPQADEALGHVGKALPERLEAERQLLQAQVLIEQNRADEAATLLGAWKGPPDWASYARFNLGVALARSGRTPDALAMLELVGGAAADGPEQWLLRDRANVALGFAAIQAKQPETARTAFTRVRLEGRYASKALLGLGWADSALDHDREALVPWTELRRRALIDPAVQEAFLAVPYAMTRLNANAQAASEYERAITTFAAETERLGRSIAHIRTGELLTALLATDAKSADLDALGTGLRVDTLPDSDESRYLVYLLASRPFQAGLRNYRDLRFLRDNLAQWSGDIAVFSDMLSAQKLAYEQRRPAVHAALQQIDLDAIDRQRAETAQRLAAIERTGDAEGLANVREVAQLATLERLGQRAQTLGDTPEGLAIREQLRLLKGVMHWDLDHDYRLRLWRQQRAQAELDDAARHAREQRHAVEQAAAGIPARLAGLGERVDAQAPRIAALRNETDRLLKRQQKMLQDLAIRELEQYQDRLQRYTVEARFALAQIYDRAAAGNRAPAADSAGQGPPP